MRSLAGRLVPAGVGALTTLTGYAALTRASTGPTAVNYRGRPVTVLAGPALAAGSGTALLVVGQLRPPARPPGRWLAAGLLAGGAAAAAGRYDDVVGSQPGPPTKGLVGHLGALRHGTVTAGTVKLAVIAAAGGAAGRLLHRDPVDAALAAGVIAGAANLGNLLDLRPGRAVKAALLAAAPTVLCSPQAGALLAGPLAAAAAVLPVELTERTMLGDTGANCLGALVGVGLAAGASRTRLASLVLVVSGLVVASERISFTDVIAATPPLRWVDGLGRRS